MFLTCPCGRHISPSRLRAGPRRHSWSCNCKWKASMNHLDWSWIEARQIPRFTRASTSNRSHRWCNSRCSVPDSGRPCGGPCWKQHTLAWSYGPQGLSLQQSRSRFVFFGHAVHVSSTFFCSVFSKFQLTGGCCTRAQQSHPLSFYCQTQPLFHCKTCFCWSNIIRVFN